MLGAFASAIDVLFADPSIARTAVYTPLGGAPVAVRVIARRPDEVVGFGESRVHTETALFDVRVSEIPSPRSGDRIEFGGITYVVQGEPERRDPDRLVWTMDTRRGSC